MEDGGSYLGLAEGKHLGIVGCWLREEEAGEGLKGIGGG